MNPDSTDLPPLPLVSHFTEHVEQQITQLSNSNDIVIIDAGAGNPRHNKEALQLAGLVIIPTAPAPLDLQATMEMASEVKFMAMKNGYPKCRILLNQVDQRKSSTQQTLNYFNDETVMLPAPPMSAAVPASEALVNAPGRGVSIYDYPGASPQLRQLFTALAQEVMGIMKIKP